VPSFSVTTRRSTSSLERNIMSSASTGYFKWFYFSLRGRTGRRSYWMFLCLPSFLAGLVLGFLTPILHISAHALIVFILALSPLFIWIGIAVSVKRLHDFGRSGWWTILCFIPYLGYVAFLVLGLMPSQIGPNAYGGGRPIDSPQTL
jgi:uncharacterized membrane protein YhaH (DUF805 family)